MRKLPGEHRGEAAFPLFGHVDHDIAHAIIAVDEHRIGRSRQMILAPTNRKRDRRAVAAIGHEARLEFGERRARVHRSEEHTSELQSLMRIQYAVFSLKKKHYIRT